MSGWVLSCCLLLTCTLIISKLKELKDGWYPGELWTTQICQMKHAERSLTQWYIGQLIIISCVRDNMKFGCPMKTSLYQGWMETPIQEQSPLYWLITKLGRIFWVTITPQKIFYICVMRPLSGQVNIHLMQL